MASKEKEKKEPTEVEKWMGKEKDFLNPARLEGESDQTYSERKKLQNEYEKWRKRGRK